MKLRRKWLAIAMGIGEVGFGIASPALAQDIRVNVTGSNIRRTDTETAAPIQTITREDIQASGLQTIHDVVRQITANNNGSISPSFTNGFSASGTAVSLRGLGPNNTLVLVNGRRMANFGLADDGHISYVDLSQIPFDAVERIEVLKDGASAIYGSDAVAGVINVILRQQYTGFTVTGTAGTSSNGEGDQYRAAITAGVGDLTKDRYNAYVTFDYQKQDAYPMNKGRQYVGTNDLRFMGLPDARWGNPLSGFPGPSLLGNVAPVSASDPNGEPGDFQSLPGACAAANQDNGFCRWDFKDYLDILPSIERINVLARGTYNVTDAIQAYTELSLFQVKSYLRGPPSLTPVYWLDPSTVSIQSTANVYLPVGHPDNPFSANDQVAILSYADGALGGTGTQYTTDTQRYLLGLKGANAGWDWDVAGLYIRTTTDITIRNVYQYDRFLAGLAGTGPYGFYRIGAAAPRNDPAVYDWIAPDLSYKTTSENTIVDAKASRDLYKLRGGQLALAIGYEFRREELSNPGMPGAATGEVVGGNASAAFGTRNVNALYAELYAPILANLEATAAIRYDHYSDVGSTWNPKIGVKWTVVPSVVLRGTWQSAFRAPGLYETSTANAYAALPVVVDPVRCPVTQSAVDCQAYVLAVITGNPYVRPETSTTYTLGAIWEPVPGLSATLDYWNIEVEDQITIGSLQATVNNPAAFPNAEIGRSTDDLPGIPNSGTLIYIKSPYQNANSVKTDGVDLDVVWKWNLKEYGMLTTEFQWTHVFDYDQTFANGETYKYAGTQGNYDVSSGSATPEDRMNLIVGWQRGPWNVAGTIRYVSDYTSTPYQGVPIPDGCLSILDSPSCHVSSFTTLDLSASYTGFKSWQIFGSIINVFNRMPPFNPAAGYGSINYNYNYAFSGATGTQFNVGVRYTFQ
ncbi:MAG: TonB-dependent receptor [Betaproteobacteria bacterium]|nr:TonB-dependent receptor [Betaproteobacteria bacterium]